MFTLILGHSKSGKSRFAEYYTARYAGGKMVYIATLIPVGNGEAGSALVARHRAQRAGMGFITVEKPIEVDTIPLSPDDSVLLEDVSNLLVNHLFLPTGVGTNHALKTVIQEVTALAQKCRHLVVVSINQFPLKEASDDATLGYIQQMGELNKQLFALANQVITLTQGKARRLK